MSYEDWLLNVPVVPAHAPAAANAWRLARTSDAAIKVHLDYKGYYNRLEELISKTKKKDEIVLVGWGFNRNQRLDFPGMKSRPLPKPGSKEPPTAEVEQTKSLEYNLRNAASRGVNVRLLVTANNGWMSQPKENVDIVSQLGLVTSSSLSVAMDTQVAPYVTHHQKSVYIKADSEPGGPFLFVGGMDVTHDRLGWFDVQAEIAGNGANLGLQTLNERWESVQGRSYRAQFASTRNKGDTYIQFVRTYGSSGTERKYGPDDSYFKLLEKAIDKASRHIYLEDHIFGETPGLDDKLVDAVNRGVTLVVVANAEEIPNAGRKSLAAKLYGNSTAKDRVRLLRLRGQYPTIHTKAWIFDDSLAVIGSANYWRSSLSNAVIRDPESEFGVAIASTAKGIVGTAGRLEFPSLEFAHALRMKLWKRLVPEAKFDTTNSKANIDADLKEFTTGSSPLRAL